MFYQFKVWVFIFIKAVGKDENFIDENQFIKSSI